MIDQLVSKTEELFCPVIVMQNGKGHDVPVYLLFDDGTPCRINRGIKVSIKGSFKEVFINEIGTYILNSLSESSFDATDSWKPEDQSAKPGAGKIEFNEKMERMKNNGKLPLCEMKIDVTFGNVTNSYSFGILWNPLKK